MSGLLPRDRGLTSSPSLINLRGYAEPRSLAGHRPNRFSHGNFIGARSSFLFDDGRGFPAGRTNGDGFYPRDASRSGSLSPLICERTNARSVRCSRGRARAGIAGREYRGYRVVDVSIKFPRTIARADRLSSHGDCKMHRRHASCRVTLLERTALTYKSLALFHPNEGSGSLRNVVFRHKTPCETHTYYWRSKRAR